MTDQPQPQPLKPASPTRRTAAAARAAKAGSSLIWLVPIIALAVTLGLAWNAYQGRGQVISVEFRDATGITPNETVLRFREIVVGRVEGVRFTEDLTSVLVDIRVDPDVAPYIDADAEFWIVRPIVSAQGISRLDTVLSGVFIEGFWDAQVGTPQTRFVGLERPALAKDAADGTWFVLASERAKGLSEGAPVLFRGLPVGRMQNLRLSPDDETIQADMFIQSPHDQRLTSATAFWDTSGFSVSLGARGLSLNVDSLATLVQGGVSFATLSSGGQPVPPGHVFRLQSDEEAARDSLMAPGDGDLRLSMLVDSNLRGLSVGADVEYNGLRVGRVTDIAINIDETRPEAEQVLQQITMAISPYRLGLDTEADHAQALDFIDERVASGLRARVASAGFFGTSLKVDLVQIPDAAVARIDRTAQPHPLMPSAPAEISDMTASAEGLMNRIGGLNLEGLIGAATDMMNSVTAIAASEDTRAIPQALRETIDESRSTMTTLREATDQIRDSGAVENATEALAQIREVTAQLGEAVQDLPELIGSARQVAENAAGVDLAAIGDGANAALGDLRAILDQDATRALPQDLRSALGGLEATLEDVRTISGQLREADAGATLARMLDEAAAAAEAVRIAATDVPAMVDKMDRAAEAIDEFDFAGISAQADGILADLRAMLGTEDAERLPRDLSDTLQAAAGLLNDLRDGNAAGSLNAALRSARVAADELATAARGLPDLSERFGQLAARAEQTVAAYGDRSQFNNEARNTMRELSRAATAFGSLARTIERNPRAFILGR
ncbi:MAG: MlaD family protein [Paracoccus sp. (in: a-proteobacteria)]|nr:MlaD family protein [Paracoccus sp. (in: a-proteobacteria)]